METQSLETKQVRKKKKNTEQHDYDVNVTSITNLRFNVMLHLLKRNGIDEVEISKCDRWIYPYYISTTRNKNIKPVLDKIHEALYLKKRLGFFTSYSNYGQDIPPINVKIKTKLLSKELIEILCEEVINEFKESTQSHILINKMPIYASGVYINQIRKVNKKYDPRNNIILDYFNMVVKDNKVDISMYNNNAFKYSALNMIKKCDNSYFNFDEYFGKENITFEQSTLMSVINIDSKTAIRLYEIVSSDRELAFTIFNKYLNEQNNDNK